MHWERTAPPATFATGTQQDAAEDSIERRSECIPVNGFKQDEGLEMRNLLPCNIFFSVGFYMTHQSSKTSAVSLTGQTGQKQMTAMLLMCSLAVLDKNCLCCVHVLTCLLGVVSGPLRLPNAKERRWSAGVIVICSQLQGSTQDQELKHCHLCVQHTLHMGVGLQNIF